MNDKPSTFEEPTRAEMWIIGIVVVVFLTWAFDGFFLTQEGCLNGKKYQEVCLMAGSDNVHVWLRRTFSR